MSTFAEQLARLRVVVTTGRCPRDLAAWALEELEELAPAGERIDARNALLREAAARVSGSRVAKANRLEREIRTLRSRLRERAADVDGVRELVARALELDREAPASSRQILRILAG
jgi:uncharacterized protein involved in exopolysaccharide biosynthesis